MKFKVGDIVKSTPGTGGSFHRVVAVMDSYHGLTLDITPVHPWWTTSRIYAKYFMLATDAEAVTARLLGDL